MLGQTRMAAIVEKVLRSVAAEVEPIVVIGTGPVGIRVVQEVLRRDPGAPIVIYGNEPYNPYNRVQLTLLLAGEKKLADLDNGLRFDREARVVQHNNCAIVAIDREARYVVDARGRRQRYGKLVLAVGSRPLLPDVPGVDLPGVYTFRSLGDAERLGARRERSRHTIVVGGGLLGVEVARAMRREATSVSLVHRGRWLMNRQLDAVGEKMLRSQLEAAGVTIYVNDTIRAVAGSTEVESVTLASGRELPCDTVIVATGIVPNTELARAAGLEVGNGIRVDDNLRTSDRHIYAIGECCEHRGRTYGVVAPGLEQARTAADNLLGGSAHYRGFVDATSLKVVGRPVLSVGRVGESEEQGRDRSIRYMDADCGIYRKVVVRNGRLIGACAIGPWTEFSRVREAVTQKRRVWPWQLWRLRRTGSLWPAPPPASVATWPATAVVCNCTGVTCGQLNQARTDGATTPLMLMQVTGASTVCGSCRPLLDELCGQPATAEPVPGQRPLLLLSLLALAVTLIIALLGPVPAASSVRLPSLDVLWTDGLYKQVSGFGLLGLSLIGLLMSLRKRVKWFRLAEYRHFRLLHVAIGLLVLVTLTAHTGLRLGANLNQMLMVDFLALLAVGAMAGGVTALERRFGSAAGRRWRRVATWGHILCSWPLPALLGFHILSVYYF